MTVWLDAGFTVVNLLGVGVIVFLFFRLKRLLDDDFVRWDKRMTELERK